MWNGRHTLAICCWCMCPHAPGKQVHFLSPQNALLAPALQAVLGIPGEFGFLKKNELFVGRVAMLGFAAELVGEVCALLLFLASARAEMAWCHPEHAELEACCARLAFWLWLCYWLCVGAV